MHFCVSAEESPLVREVEPKGEKCQRNSRPAEKLAGQVLHQVGVLAQHHQVVEPQEVLVLQPVLAELHPARVDLAHRVAQPFEDLWTSDGGMQNLRDLSIASGVTDLTNWSLSDATGVCADGLVIVGYGINRSGGTEAWIATISEALSPVLVLVGLTALVGLNPPPIQPLFDIMSLTGPKKGL